MLLLWTTQIDKKMNNKMRYIYKKRKVKQWDTFKLDYCVLMLGGK